MLEIFLKILLLIVIDVVLSIDNSILLITTSSKLQDKRQQKQARILGGLSAVILRLIFVIGIILFGSLLSSSGITIPFIYLISGGVLLYIAISFLSPEQQATDIAEDTSMKVKLFRIVILILLGDVMMSFDNAFVIASISSSISQDFWTIVSIAAFAIFISLVIILFFSSFLAKILEKHEWIKVVCSWLLLTMGVELIIQDPFVTNFLLQVNQTPTFFLNNKLNLFIMVHLIATIILAFAFKRGKSNEKNTTEGG